VIASIALLAAVTGAPQAPAERHAATPDQIVAVASDCAAASTVNGVDKSILEKAGWSAKTPTVDGKPMQTSLSFYHKQGSAALVTLDPSGEGAKLCIAIAPIQSRNQFKTFADAMTVKFGPPRIPGSDELIWNAGGEMIDLALTGKPDNPGIRVVTKQASEENK
jgi:hypothetical protein